MGWLANETGLGRCEANYVPLTPLSFLHRARQVYPDHMAVVYGPHRKTYAEYHERVSRLASALTKIGVEPGDVVATILPNIPAQAEAHFGVPACGAVLNAINTRLDIDTIAYILDHGEAKVVLCDPQFIPHLAEAIEQMEQDPPTVIEVADPHGGAKAFGDYLEYEDFLGTGDPHFTWIMPEDEWESLALNYTSGTTGRPKGVVYHHRGAYLNAMGQVLSWRMVLHPVYLTIVPLFHCNGWCFAWTVAARAGVNICLRKIDPAAIFAAIRDHRVTHYCGAPIVHSMLIDAAPEHGQGIDHAVQAMVAGAAPPAAMIEAMEGLGFDLTHVYGLTETYGPAAVCEKHEDWTELPVEDRARLNAKQGVRYHLQEAITVLDPATMEPVPADGETVGEVMFRGNITMKGYLKNPSATQAAFAGGWFHTGDLGVLGPDGYVKIKDRSKDIIISGGENISSLEVEDVLHRHPAVSAVAVVAQPDDKWGETPCAFIELRPGAEATPEALTAFCKERLAGFKVPRNFVFGALPRTSTGKVQKYELRDRVGSASAIDE